MEKKAGEHLLRGLVKDIESEYEISNTGYGLESVEETDEERLNRQTGNANPTCGGL
ncbi:hypothetical protein [Bacillus sp. S/N-304-OC-R1]|uniref:hypothetical protein n=1 Tax=Bacillus sp. S/N-304-OC-R1 TaxID=2758034 RepID=UPI001C8E3A04|nr:hypothetical protein [Bacillus sp. S/N-304-OC-R1]MBY0121339.1 hypothetical protein [Bacillus sp. S/N-304-OC-R1]